jgi:DNA-binding transcriptional LysR family regulator
MNTDDLTLFVRIADNGSITGAAEQLDMTIATASAGLKRLEKQLKVQLFTRSTRQLRITAEGERFLSYCREALRQLNEGEASLHALTGKIAGKLLISAPSDLGRNLLLPWINDLIEEHQDLSINLTISDSLSDFYLDQVDIAIRYGVLQDSSMIAFKLANIEGAICASPSYLKKFGIPKNLADLQQHNCLLYRMNNRTYDVWEFTSGVSANIENYKIKVSGNLSSNNSEIVRLWALAGKGIIYKSQLDMAEDIRANRLVKILDEYQPRAVDLNMICPSRAQITPAVLLLRDILKTKFSQLLLTNK